MLSAALAGILRVGAVFLVAGGLAGGVYLLVQVGEEDDSSRLQTDATATVGAPAPLSPPAGLSPPADVTRPPTPTPTYPPAPTPAGPAVDTSDWKTYTSPEGFSFKYPPGWEVKQWPPYLRVVSPQTAQAIADERMGRSPGMAEVAFFSVTARFDANALIEDCERPLALDLPGDRPNSGSAVTFLGRRAVQCLQSGIGPGGGVGSLAQWLGLTYSVDLPPDTVMTITGYVVPQGEIDFATIEAIMATFSLGAAQ